MGNTVEYRPAAGTASIRPAASILLPLTVALLLASCTGKFDPTPPVTADPRLFGLNQAALLCYVLAFCLGGSAIFLFSMVNRKMKLAMMGHYVAFNWAFLALMVLGFAETYLHFLGLGPEAPAFTVFYWATFAWGCLIAWVLPRFILAFAEAPAPRWLMPAALGSMAAQTAAATAITLLYRGTEELNRRLVSGLEWVWTPFLLVTLGYCLFVLVRHRSILKDELKLRIIRAILLLTAIFSPAIVIDILQPLVWIRHPWFPYGLKLTVFYYMAWMATSLFMVASHFVSRIRLSQEYELKAELMDKHGITPREREVIMKMAEGKTLARIAEELFISYKTVDNHVSNIYRKTGVSGRKELFRLFR